MCVPCFCYLIRVWRGGAYDCVFGLVFYFFLLLVFALASSYLVLSLPTQIVFRWKEAFSLYCLVESFSINPPYRILVHFRYTTTFDHSLTISIRHIHPRLLEIDTKFRAVPIFPVSKSREDFRLKITRSLDPRRPIYHRIQVH